MGFALPGTGKTMLAKCVASTYLTCSRFVRTFHLRNANQNACSHSMSHHVYLPSFFILLPRWNNYSSAAEGGASFLSVDASSVENKWLGESEKNAKAVFTLARRLAPCVIFVDEVDSLLSSRQVLQCVG